MLHDHFAFFLAPRFFLKSVGSLNVALEGMLIDSPMLVICDEYSSS